MEFDKIWDLVEKYSALESELDRAIDHEEVGQEEEIAQLKRDVENARKSLRDALKTPILEVGDIICVENWGFRLEEFTMRPAGDVHVRFINANEMAKSPPKNVDKIGFARAYWSNNVSEPTFSEEGFLVHPSRDEALDFARKVANSLGAPESVKLFEDYEPNLAINRLTLEWELKTDG